VQARRHNGLGHADRVRIAQALAAGANSHHLLAQASGLKAGPLYHHLRELERAGLVLLRRRNVYALTEFGRAFLAVNVMLSAYGVERGGGWREIIVRDRREDGSAPNVP
jgi:DNA-binding HxlR family transcriptional regulator